MPSPQASVRLSRSTARGRRVGRRRPLGAVRRVRPVRVPPPGRRCRRGGAGRGRRLGGGRGLLTAAHRADGGTAAHVAGGRWRRRGRLRAATGPGVVAPRGRRRRRCATQRRAGRGKAAAPESERSSTLTRSDSASMPESRSGRTARTTAISSTTCASGASRMSTSAWPEDLHAAHDPGQPHRLGQRRRSARATGPTPRTARAPARRGTPGAGRRSARWPAAGGPSRRPAAR